MTHTPLLIKGDELRGRVYSDCDWDESELADTLGLKTKRMYWGEWLVDWTDQALNSWWIVRWPDHVINASFNGDATYGQILPKDYNAYVNEGVKVYGECEI